MIRAAGLEVAGAVVVDRAELARWYVVDLVHGVPVVARTTPAVLDSLRVHGGVGVCHATRLLVAGAEVVLGTLHARLERQVPARVADTRVVRAPRHGQRGVWMAGRAGGCARVGLEGVQGTRRAIAVCRAADDDGKRPRRARRAGTTTE